MALDLAIKMVGLKALQGRMKKARPATDSNFVRGMKRAVELVRGRVQFNMRGSRASNPPDRLGRISGRLAGSVVGRTDVTGNQIVGRVGTRVVYARIHEFGGVIRARSAPFLKFKIGDSFRQVKSVRIPPRPSFGPALEWARPRIITELGKGIQAGLRGQRAG